MGYLTTHVLDSANGIPGAGISIKLFYIENNKSKLISSCVTNDDGRCDGPLLEGEAFVKGIYQLEFNIGDYYRVKSSISSEPDFLNTVVIRFGVSKESEHYHIPLLVSPYSYSTYRGS